MLEFELAAVAAFAAAAAFYAAATWVVMES